MITIESLSNDRAIVKNENGNEIKYINSLNIECNAGDLHKATISIYMPQFKMDIEDINVTYNILNLEDYSTNTLLAYKEAIEKELDNRNG